MVLEKQILPYFQWLLYGTEQSWGALPKFLVVAVAIAFLGLLVGYLISAARYGLLRGGDAVYRTVTGGFREIFQLSPRRVWALARLAMKEAWRRRVIVALAVFGVILLFATWFLKTDNQDPAKLFNSFVLTATTYLVLAIALLLSAFSLPSDFKTKTIYTVVTKPVRSGEIILGRIIGFTLVGTILLVVMGICSYVFVLRMLGHEHAIDTQSLRRIPPTGEVFRWEGSTTLDNYHRHDLELDADKSGNALSNHGHYHAVTEQGEVLGAEGIMRARVPQYGQLRFLDRQGVEKQEGISVGNEWTYRSFMEGGRQAAAIWTFDNVNPSMGPDGLPIGLIVRVFRTYKGVVGQPITGSIHLRNPETGLETQMIAFSAQDAKVDEREIDRKLTSTEGEPVDLYDDLVSSTGQLEIWVRCLERGQYFGFAQPDCYLRLPEASPVINYIKVFLSIWVQMAIVISIGVAGSAVLSGPVAMLLTVSFVVLGFFREFFVRVATETSHGGGPIESLYRLITQKNVISPLDPGVGTNIIQGIDNVLETFMWSIAQVLPDFSAFSTVNFAAFGYNVPIDRVLQDLTVFLAYFVGLAVLGYFLLRTREIAK